VALRKTLILVCGLAALVCLSGGFALKDLWIAAGFVFIPILGLLLANWVSASWLPIVSLISLVGMAAVGLETGAQPYLMILGSSAALACWDQLNLDRRLRDGHDLSRVSGFERKQAGYLAAALGSGLVLAFTGSVLTLQLPFIAILLVAVLILYSLDRVSRYLTKNG
jgi:uncharacterized membrane protein AbrB (regulator of aidB expression)